MIVTQVDHIQSNKQNEKKEKKDLALKGNGLFQQNLVKVVSLFNLHVEESLSE